ncbi:hypothetical protein PHISCL_06467 [Aspergillus sclerotialis]|uniref:Uncharacterized protein n=1 Tax=Aspergillus sclerotialis TaxID=2070753 RepID=A0A3A2ZVZ2_9EURO|nr:hypothetical protein PHISCL_06467 [Aspergillus sclerotialis]
MAPDSPGNRHKAFEGMATREVNGVLIGKLWKKYPALCGGGADLFNSTKFPYGGTDVFHPSVGYSGRYIRHWIREHAIASIANGLAAYNPGTFLPLTATFLVVYLYVTKGAYVVVEVQDAKISLASSGTNLHYAVAAADSLTRSGIATSVVSAPSFEHFDQQDESYEASVFPRDGTAIVSVEEYVATTWARYTTASIGITGYGYSASNPSTTIGLG